MKINKDVSNVENQPLIVTVVFSGGEKVGDEVIDDLLQVSVTLELNPRTSQVSYKAHKFETVGSNLGYIPRQTRTLSPMQLFQAGWLELMKAKGFEQWRPKLQQEIDDYIKEATKKKKSFSMKGDLNKAIFVATYLYYLNTVPLAIESRHEQICEKLNMSSGSFTKNLSRVSVPLADCQEYSKKKKVNIFRNLDKMRINDKDVFLMSNSEPKLKGGYITPYAVDLIENYMLEYWNNKGLNNSYQPTLDPVFQQAFVGA